MPSTEADELFQNARQAFYGGQFSAAEVTCRKILRIEPEHADGALLLGLACLQLGKSGDALKYIQLHLRAVPESVVGNAAVSNLLSRTGRPDEARRHAQKAIELRPGDPSLHAGFARDLETAGFAGEAATVLNEALRNHSLDLGFIRGLAAFLLQANKKPQALTALAQSVELNPEASALWLVLGELRSMSEDFAGAVECGRQAVRCDGNSIDALRLLASAHATLGHFDEAAKQYQQITDLSPADSEAWFALGSHFQRKGEFAEAKEFLTRSTKERPSNGIAQYALLRSRNAGPNDHELILELERLADDAGTRPFDRLNLYFAIGKAREDREEFEKAMAAYDAANLLGYEYYQDPRRPWDPVRDLEFYKHLTTTFSGDVIRNLQKKGLASGLPVLIVGMPRSGTSLVEQILSNHPQVAGAGEVAFWNEPSHRLAGRPGQPVSQTALFGFAEEYLKILESIRGDALRVTDKVPQNFLVLGVICAAFPNARVIHVQRNAIDTCLSIFTTGFGTPPPFSHRRRDIVAAYREYDRAMNCWRKALSEGQMLEVTYEDIVADGEKMAREMVAFLGLAWDDACAHHETNKRPVETASLWQVRQRIYQSSIGRSHAFRPWLGELLELEGG